MSNGAYASGRGMSLLAKRYLEGNEKATCLTMDRTDAKTICDAAKAGDKCADDILWEYADYLAEGIGTATTLLNPDVVAIGGGVSAAGYILIDKVREKIKKYVFHASENVEIKFSELGSDAGIYGAAKLVV